MRLLRGSNWPATHYSFVVAVISYSLALSSGEYCEIYPNQGRICLAYLSDPLVFEVFFFKFLTKVAKLTMKE